NSGAEAASLHAIPLEDVRARGRGRSAEELEARRAAVRPEDPFTFIYTSGTTGPPKGCVLTHGNYRAIIDMVGEAGEIQGDEVIYLYLPLAHSFALLIQLAVFDLGGTLAYFGGDTKQIVPELQEVKPTYLPSVPRVFEKIYTLAHGAIEAQGAEDQARAEAAIKLGAKVRDMINRGEAVPEELQKPFQEADEQLFKNVRAIFGGAVRHATSGAAPIARTASDGPPAIESESGGSITTIVRMPGIWSRIAAIFSSCSAFSQTIAQASESEITHRHSSGELVW
ncbi:MAG TPA: AMP-binding protein, partial [Kofleriaceae bacterium]|nr:AMP-binding protein [Kofleriaceae bacterium]